jgi:hypothetical protein
MVLVISFIVLELVMPQGAYAAGGLGGRGEKKPDAVITAEKPSALKIWFGAGMLVAGILAVKYL